MNNAVRWMAMSLGGIAAVAGLQHGYAELQQGATVPETLLISTIGPPCDPEAVWHACEPAMTILPTFQLAGIVTLTLSAVMLVLALFFLHRRHVPLVFMLLTIPWLLFGGGIMPPLMAFIAGGVATRIHAPLTWWRARTAGTAGRMLASLWPWMLIAFLAWTLAGQYVMGYYFNDFIRSNTLIFMLLLFGPLVIAIVAAFAFDARREADSSPRSAHSAAAAP